MAIIPLRHVQMQKFISPQVIDSIRDKEAKFPIMFKLSDRVFPLYNQYVRKNYIGR